MTTDEAGFAAIGAALGAPTTPGATDLLPPELTPEAAGTRIAELKADPAFQEKYLSGEAAARAEFSKLIVGKAPNESPRKRPKAKRREPPPLETVDAQDGPAMKALPTDRHRAFVRAMYQVKPGHGAAVRAAKLAGFGTPQSSPQSMATIASRLTHDERVQEAFAEHDQLFIRASAPRAIRSLLSLIENPKAKDHARGIAMVLDRVHPAEQIHKVKHEHDIGPNVMETAQIMRRIAELSAKFSVMIPAPMRQIGGPIIDGEATLISQSGGGQ